jgi:hypothetical protein
MFRGMVDFRDRFQRAVSGELHPLARPVSLAPGQGELMEWRSSLPSGRCKLPTRRIVFVVPWMFSAADLTQPLRGVLDLHRSLVQIIESLAPILGILTEPSETPERLVLLVIGPRFMWVGEARRRLPLLCTPEIARAEAYWRKPEREELRLEAILASDDRDCVPWLYSALYNLGFPIGAGNEPALRLLLLFLGLWKFSQQRARPIYPRGLQLQNALPSPFSLAQWFHKEVRIWQELTSWPLAMPTESEGILHQWMGPYSDSLRSVLEDYSCLATRRGSLEALSRAASSRAQVSATFQFLSQLQLPITGRWGNRVVIPIDDMGPFGLVLVLQDMLRAEWFRRRQASNHRRPVREARQEQSDLFPDLLTGHETDCRTMGVAESVISHRIRVQSIVPSSYELAFPFLQKVLWEWSDATGEVLPSLVALHSAFPKPEIVLGASFL